MTMRRQLLGLVFVVACGGSVAVGDDGVGGGTGTGTASSSGSSSGNQPCYPCTNAFSTSFDPDRVCPGEERDKYDALVACGCQEATCGAPDGPGYDCFDPTWELFLCTGGYIDGTCGGCLYEHCLAERSACEGEDPP